MCCRQLNPMYEGYLQHDAQEVLQCILGYIQEACDTIRKDQELDRESSNMTEVKRENDDRLGSSSSAAECVTPTEEDGQVSGKRKSDTEVGNAKKKPKSGRKSDAQEDIRHKPFTRSKRRSSSDLAVGSAQSEIKDEGTATLHKEERGSDSEGKGEKASVEADGKRKKKGRLSWLRSSGKQPSIFSKFYSVRKISCTTAKNQNKAEQENEPSEEQSEDKKATEERVPQDTAEDKGALKHQGRRLFLHAGWQILLAICLKGARNGAEIDLNTKVLRLQEY